MPDTTERLMTAMLRRQIMAQADAAGASGWMSIAVPEEVRAGGRLRVPRGAFEMWAVARSHGGHLAVPWTSVSPRGLKQDSDDPYHTDWMIGAGLDPKDMKSTGTNPHWEGLKDAAYHARFEVEKRLLGFSCSVLLPGPTVRGRVFAPARPRDAFPECDEDGLPPILVVGNVGADWLEPVLATLELGGAVVAERGGEMAHLVTVVRETGNGPILRAPDARRLYHAGAVVTVSPLEGRISLVEDDRLADLFEPPPAVAEVRQVEARSEPAEGASGPRDFGLTEKRPGGTHPAENCRYLEPRRKIEEPGHTVYANRLFDDPNASRFYLMIMVKEKGNGRTRRRTFYSALREWRTAEVTNACLQALYVAMESRPELERLRREALCQHQQVLIAPPAAKAS